MKTGVIAGAVWRVTQQILIQYILAGSTVNIHEVACFFGFEVDTASARSNLLHDFSSIQLGQARGALTAARVAATRVTAGPTASGAGPATTHSAAAPAGIAIV